MMDNFDSLRWLADQGARFATPYGRSKNKFEDGWPEKPHTLDEAIIHARRGGNVGVLTGIHSDGIVAIDRDVHFSETVEMLGDLGKTAKIVRDNAPERGKFLYRLDGAIPPSVVWKENPTDKHPSCEFLAKGRHALTDPSESEGGHYRLIDSDYGIQKITLVELEYIWRLITGGSIHKEQRAKEDAEQEKVNKDDFVRQVKEAWPVATVFEHFDRTTHGTAKDKDETRLLGNGGLLVSADGKQWYCHADSVGGDNLDAWAYCRWNKRVDRAAPRMFWDVINDMAGVAGIVREQKQVHANGYSNQTAKVDADILNVPDDTTLPVDKYFLLQSADDEGNAQCVNKIHGHDFAYCDAYGWMENVGTYWQFGGLAEKGINLAITQTLIDRRVAAARVENEKIIKATKPSASNKENTKRQFKDLVWSDVSMFDQEKHLLNCRNGVIDLRNSQLISHSPSNRFTYCVNAEYDPNIDPALWVSFLAESVKDYDQVQEWLQMACGYSITGYTNEEIMFYLYGPARSGKGTFTNAFLHMLGHPLAAGINFSTFTARRDGDSQNFDLAPLKPCRFISASESGKYQSLNEAVLKQATGNDPIRAALKGKDHFTFFPQFKIWLSSNHPVRGDVDDDAFWGRVKIIEFPISHLGDEDKTLKERMQSEEYRAALLAWSVFGAQMWHNEARGLKTPLTIQASVSEQRSQLDSIQRWLDECTKQIDGVSTTNKVLRRSYEEWCRENGENPKFAVQFGRSLKAKGYEDTNIKVHGLSERGYKNIGLLRAEED